MVLSRNKMNEQDASRAGTEQYICSCEQNVFCLRDFVVSENTENEFLVTLLSDREHNLLCIDFPL